MAAAIQPQQTGRFGLSPKNLVDMIQSKDPESVIKLGGVAGIAQALNTDPARGLASTELANLSDRFAVFGVNKIPSPPPESFLMLFLGALKDTTLLILQGAAIISLILGIFFSDPDESVPGWVDGLAILVTVLICAGVTSVNDWSKDRQFRKLNDTKKDIKIKVTRAGVESQLISIYDLVVGDIVELATGDTVPADGVLVGGHNLEVDESAMTGESVAVRKSLDKSPYLLSGTFISDGLGTMLVTGVGLNTEWGSIMSMLSDDDDSETPLQENLGVLSKRIGFMGLVFAVLTFIALVIRFAVTMVMNDLEWDWGVDVLKLVKFFIIAVTIIVVAVPEGLPLAVTISLAYSMRLMMNDQNLVRHLAACETMGSATTICSDKTGTLTENRMTVVQAFMCDRLYEEIPATSALTPAYVYLLCEGIAVNSTASIINSQQTGLRDFVGNKTEGALLVLCEHFDMDYLELRNHSKSAIVALYAFSSARKRMTTVIQRRDSAGFRVHTKGAPEILLERCAEMIDSDGSIVALTPEARQRILGIVEQMGSQGLRPLSLCFKDIDTFDPNTPEPPENDLIFLGLVGIKDPLRKEVKEAVHQCQMAGIVVRMVTGDTISTATAIARECGILTDGIAITGKEFRSADPERQMREIVPRLQVLARSSPTDKFDLVSRLKAMDEVVAVTGDGTNDAAALNEADVGLSMGIAGTEVAKEASDIIILDDNFASVVKSVMWGRSVYDNIRKFLQFQLTVNVVALLVAFIGAITGESTPLTAVQMLWVNLIMDSFAALALATEPPTPDLLKRAPYGRFESLISPVMLRNIIGHSVYQLIVLFVLLYAGNAIFHYPETVHGDFLRHTYTMVFNSFVLCQLFNEINARKVNSERNMFEGIMKSKFFLMIVGGTAVAQLVIVEAGGALMETKGLHIVEWIVGLLIGAMELPIGFGLSYLKVPLRWNRPIKPEDLAKRRELQARKSKQRQEEREKRQKAMQEKKAKVLSDEASKKTAEMQPLLPARAAAPGIPAALPAVAAPATAAAVPDEGRTSLLSAPDTAPAAGARYQSGN